MKTRVDRILQKMKSNNVKRNEVITVEEIKKFERENGIKLPKELVIFYTEISNGCKMIDGCDLLKMEEWKYKVDNINKDFLFTEYWIWEDDYDEERVKHIVDGNLELINIGDSQTWNIIINGKEEGKMWFFTDVGIQPCAPSMNFLEWFEFWLDGNEDYFYEFNYVPS